MCAETTTGQVRTDADHHQEQLVAEASALVATAAIQWQRAQAATKIAKKEFDTAVERLQHLVNAGPERLPLFDQPTKPPTYEPPLQEGQCRVRIIQIDPTTEESEVPEEFVSNAVVVMTAPTDERLYDPEANDNSYFTLNGATDDYEVLEHWPDDEAAPTIHNPPLRFGPNEPEETSQDSEAWKQKLVESLGIPKSTINKLVDAGIATVGLLSGRMQKGGHDWHRDVPGLGPKAAEKVADAFDKFWKEHPEACE